VQNRFLTGFAALLLLSSCRGCRETTPVALPSSTPGLVATPLPDSLPVLPSPARLSYFRASGHYCEWVLSDPLHGKVVAAFDCYTATASVDQLADCARPTVEISTDNTRVRATAGDTPVTVEATLVDFARVPPSAGGGNWRRLSSTSPEDRGESDDREERMKDFSQRRHQTETIAHWIRLPTAVGTALLPVLEYDSDDLIDGDLVFVTGTGFTPAPEAFRADQGSPDYAIETSANLLLFGKVGLCSYRLYDLTSNSLLWRSDVACSLHLLAR
jgi:hypothetical protein